VRPRRGSPHDAATPTRWRPGTAARGFPLLAAAALALTLCFLALPIVAIFVDVPPHDLVSALGDPVAVDALRLSLETTAIALALIVLVGTPAAWLLATRRFRGRDALVTLVELPLLVPPAVAGIGLLAAFGPHGLLGGALSALHIELVLQTAGVVVALTFVASPFYLRQAQAGFAALDPALLEASRTLGSSEARTFGRVGVPAAAGALGAGAALSWGRALGEFGATLMFAGSYRGVTQTAPLAIYERFAVDFPAALALSAVLVAAGAGILLGTKLALRRGDALG
jgi:molybdate transport system permease protein